MKRNHEGDGSSIPEEDEAFNSQHDAVGLATPLVSGHGESNTPNLPVTRELTVEFVERVWTPVADKIRSVTLTKKIKRGMWFSRTLGQTGPNHP